MLKRREGVISEGKLPEIYFEKVRFDELAAEFLADYRINQHKSLRRAKISVEHLKKYFEHAKVVNITSPKIKTFIEERKQFKCKEYGDRFEGDSSCQSCGSYKIKPRAANATINRELSALKHAESWRNEPSES